MFVGKIRLRKYIIDLKAHGERERKKQAQSNKYIT